MDRREVMKILENISNGYKRIATGIAIVSFLAILYLAMIPGVSVAVQSYVMAASGTPIAGAFVKIMEWPQYNATTDVNGNYTMPNVPIGTYSVAAKADGYAPNITTFTVVQGSNILNFALTPGTLFYMPFLYQRADNIYDAAVQVQNNGTTNASVEIQFYYLNGTLAGSNIYSVHPGELMTKHVFDITGSMPAFVGPAVVRSDIPVQVQGYILTVSQAVYSIAPSSTNTATSAYLPFLYQRADNIYDAGVQVFNPGTLAANVTINMYYLNGTLAGSGTYLVNPNAEISKYAFDITGSMPAFVGPAEVTSDQPVVAQGFIRTKASAIYSIAPSVSTTVVKAYVPFLYQRADNIYDAGVQVFNPGATAANVTISMYYLNGTLAGSGTYPVNSKAEVSKYAFDITGSMPAFVGPAEVTSDQPVVAQGFIRTKASAVYSIAPQVRKPASASQAHVPYLYQTFSATHDSGIQAMNPNNVAANVTISLYYPNGTQAGTFSASLAPYAELSKYAFDIAPNSADFNGSATVTADQPVVSQGFIRMKSSNIYSIAPPVER